MMKAKQSRSQDSQSELNVLCRESDSDYDERTPQRRKRKKHNGIHSTSKRVRLATEKHTSVSWKQQCLRLIDRIFQWDDSTPFRYPMSTVEYPDYRDIVDCPMDLSTVREKLNTNLYNSPTDFCKDMRLIFKNSRNYNTNKKSRIYSMTIRLSAKFEEHIRQIISDWRSAVKYEEKLKNNHYVSSRSSFCVDPIVLYLEMEAKQSRSQDSQSELDVLCSESNRDDDERTPQREKRKKVIEGDESQTAFSGGSGSAPSMPQPSSSRPQPSQALEEINKLTDVDEAWGLYIASLVRQQQNNKKKLLKIKVQSLIVKELGE